MICLNLLWRQIACLHMQKNITCRIKNRTTSFCMSGLPVASAVMPPAAPDEDGSPPYEHGGGAAVRRLRQCLCPSWRLAAGHAGCMWLLHLWCRGGVLPATLLPPHDRSAHRGACVTG